MRLPALMDWENTISLSFMNGLQQAIGFIQEQQGCYTRHTTDEEAESPETGKEELPKEEKASSLEGEIKIDIEF